MSSAPVAVVVRTRNRPLLLARALRSVLAQRFGDYQVVVVNDAGDLDAVHAVVDPLREEFGDRLRIVHNEVSGGREAAMNRGIEASESEFLTIHDDDDTWDPDFLSRTVAHLAEHADQVGVATRTAVVHERIEGDRIVEERRELLATDRTQVSLIDTIVLNGVPPISLVYRRAVLAEIGWYDESLPVLSDWDFMLKLLTHGPVGFLDGDPLAFWHLRPTAVGDASNSIYLDGGHDPWNLVVRDQHLRRDLAAHDGLGVLLALTELRDRDRKHADARGDALSGAVLALQRETGEIRQDVGALRGLHTELAVAVQHLYDAQRSVVQDLQRINRNLVSQNNRLVAQFERLTERLEAAGAVTAAVPVGEPAGEPVGEPVGTPGDAPA